MADQDVLDPRQRVERQVADAGAGVDEDVVVEKEGGGPAAGGDGAGATEYLDDHGCRGWRAPLQLGSSGFGVGSGYAMFSRGGRSAQAADVAFGARAGA